MWLVESPGQPMTDWRPMSDLHTTIAGLARARPVLELRTAHICLLVAMRVHTRDEVLAELDEDRLTDLYVEVVEVVEGGSRLPRKKARHALQALREQGLLSRVDGAGLVRAGDYALTRLGAAIADTWLEDDALTRDSLVLLTTMLRAKLGTLLTSAAGSPNDAEWEHIRQELRVTVQSLVEGIDRRRRGLDRQQAEVQEQISAQLEQGWFEAVESCERLLDHTTGTLSELKDVLLQETGELLNLLGELEALATHAVQDDAADAARHAQLQVDGIAAWGRARHEAWSDYFSVVQRFLREHVRLDPQRAVSQRLQRAITAWPDSPWAFAVPDPQPYRFLREIEVHGGSVQVSRPAAERERELELVAPEDERAALAHLVQEWLETRTPSTLSTALRDLLPGQDRFRRAGRIARLLVDHGKVRSERERAWVAVDGELEVEEWQILGVKGP